MSPTFTALLDEYLHAKDAFDKGKAKPGSGYGGDPYIGADPLVAERQRYDKAAAALNTLVDHLLEAERSIKTRDIAQPLYMGFP